MLRRTRMVDFFGICVCQMSVFWRGINTKINSFSIDANRGLPFGSPIIPTNTSKSAFVSFISILLIMRVLLLCYYTQIFQPIVRAISIYMVNVSSWKFSMNNCPNNSMRFVHFFTISKLYVAVSVQALRWSICTFAYKNTCIGVVIKRFTKFGNINVVHG